MQGASSKKDRIDAAKKSFVEGAQVPFEQEKESGGTMTLQPFGGHRCSEVLSS